MLQRTMRLLGLATVIAASIFSQAQAQAQAQAQTILTGQTKGGAYYRIAVPDAWNGDLVIWNHGYDPAPVGPVNPETGLGPLVDLQLLEGYAVAASSYQQSGWAVFRTRKDIKRLIDEFEDLVDEPNNIILTGASLGGIVTADALERADIDNVVGAFAFCGAMAGSRIWDGAHDLRLTYDVICGEIPGAAIPGGATGLPRDRLDITGLDVALAVNACTGVLLQPPNRTDEQKENMDKILSSTQLPERFLLTDMGFATFEIRDLIFDPGKLKGGRGLGNIGVEYGDPAVDATIERVQADRKAAKKLKKNFTPKGDLENDDVKIVSIHTDKDGLVIVENEKEYQDVIDADNLTVAVAVEAVPTHCGFTPAEVVAGWEALRGWVAGLPQPNAQDLQDTCQGIEIAGLGVGGPCRFDPSFVIADMDGRIPARDNTKKPKKKKKKKKKHDDDSDSDSDG